jgi:glycosyltransferase involved in cell wall biosynthesis
MIRRILMTGDTVGGVWAFTMELAEALAAHGVEVVLAALGGPPSASQRAEAGRVARLELLESDFKLEWMDNPWRDVAESGHWLLDLEEQYAPEVVHLNSYGHGALNWRTPVVLTAHSCVLSWWKAVKGSGPPAVWDRYRETVAASLRAADVVTAPSSAMAQSIAEHYSAGDCRVIPNGRCPRRFRSEGKQPMVLTAGRLWDEAKNVAAVAGVAARIDWPVCVAGEHRHPNGTSREWRECTMLGRLSSEELAEWYARAAIFALPARYEPFGLAALEAAHSGCALALGDIPSLREVWGDAAVYVAPDDPRALETALRKLIADPAYRASMAAAAQERAGRYTPARMAESYLEAYGEAAQRRRVCAS